MDQQMLTVLDLADFSPGTCAKMKLFTAVTKKSSTSMIVWTQPNMLYVYMVLNKLSKRFVMLRCGPNHGAVGWMTH